MQNEIMAEGRRESVLFRRGALLAMGLWGAFLVFGAPLQAQRGSQKRGTPNLVIESTTRFRSLDGSSADLDGSADGILTLNSLLITGQGTLVLDVPRAIISVHGDVILEERGRIGGVEPERRSPSGPSLVLRSDSSVRIMGDASVAVDGREAGGSIFVCANSVDLLGRAALTASGGRQAGGSISLNATKRVVLGASVSLEANGSYGGQISIRSCDPEKDAILLQGGRLEARGNTELGGQIRLEATTGGIEFVGDRTAGVVMVALGNPDPGQVELVAALGIAPILRDVAQPSPSILNRAQPLVECECAAFAPVLEVDPPASPTASLEVEITGRASAPGRLVRIHGLVETVDATAGNDRRFSAMARLAPNQLNNIFVSEEDQGVPGPQLAVRVIQDSQAPSLFIDSPSDEDRPSNQTIDVAGRVGDMLSGFMGLTVVVNGVEAVVDVGVGNNGTFLARDVLLNPSGEATELEAIARDALGNSSTTSASVTFEAPPMGEPRILFVSGNGQAGRVNTRLPLPIRVLVLDGNDNPMAMKAVTFHVTRSDGRLSSGAIGGSMMFQAFTDGNGIAEAYWTLGSDAGCGNNRVEATSAMVFGSVGFCASATPAPARQINMGSGGNQIAEAGAITVEPLRAWVSDGCNGVEGVPVTFRVTRGGGSLDGQLQATVLTSQTGHAQVPFRIGSTPGINTVEASFAANTAAPATFLIRGIARDQLQPTTFAGLVLDNGNQPIQGATCTLELSGVTFGPEVTDEEGQFLFQNLPIAGPGHLHVDGLTAPPENSFPGLSYLVVLVPNAENRLPMGAVLLPRLNPNNERTYDARLPEDGGQPTVLEVEGVDGLKMVVTPGSMMIHGAPAPSGTKIFLNQVHHDDVPMPMPDGVASPFAWTLQPSGATFDPPIQIIYPNMTGLPAGAIAYFLNFNHETGRFEIIGSGHVSEDGSEIRSDSGIGITVAGWGCNCPPYAVTDDCEKCNIKTEGPEFACGVPETYTVTVRGNGFLTWKITDGNDVTVADPISVTDGGTYTRSVMFQTPGPAGSANTSGSKVEALLECEEALSDEHGVGVTVVKVEWDPSRVKVRNLPHFGGHEDQLDKTLPVVFGVSPPGTSIDLSTYLTIESDVENVEYLNGSDLLPDSMLPLGGNPGDLAVTVFQVTARHKKCEEGLPASLDKMYVVVSSPATDTNFATWATTWSTPANMVWLGSLPPVYATSTIGADPEPAACSPQLWNEPEGITGAFFHPPTSAFPNVGHNMRSTDVGGIPFLENGSGHQAVYTTTGAIITFGIGAGSADRYTPGFPQPQLHRDADVLPFVRAAQLDGNPIEANNNTVPTNLDVPLLYVGTHLAQYLALRPTLAANPQTAGTCVPSGTFAR